MDAASNLIATIEALGNRWNTTVTLSYNPESRTIADDRRWQICLGTTAVGSGTTAVQAANALLAKLRLEDEA